MSDGITVVTGMHRSGTSAVSQLLEGLGVDFGPHEAFYGADQWNPNGYFERRDVIDVNSRLVTGFPRTEGGLAAAMSQLRYLTLPSQATIHRRGRRMAEEVAATAATLDGLAVKDPRFCLTLATWAPHVRRVVVSIRHPLAVARSLQRRQRVPMALGLRFWLHHAEPLVQQLDDTAVVIDFDSFGSPENERQVRRLVEVLGLDVTPEEAVATVASRYDPSLRHHRIEDDAELPQDVAEAWAPLRGRALA